MIGDLKEKKVIMLRADNSRIRREAEKRNLPLSDAILYGLRQLGLYPTPTVIAGCPTSEAVVRALIDAARNADAPLFFAATLNQVDRDGGYTGWTPSSFVEMVRSMVNEAGYEGPVGIGLDHGGPWLKESHVRESLVLNEAMAEVKDSLTACLDAGYDLLHIDATVDRTLLLHQTISIHQVIDRTVDLITHCEQYRVQHNLPAVSYEVGTEEVKGGLADLQQLQIFLAELRSALQRRHLAYIYPTFVVCRMGTNLHTEDFDLPTAQRVAAICEEYHAVTKAHYTDWVAHPESYPLARVGGANVGPEFSEAEYFGIAQLAEQEIALARSKKTCRLSDILPTIRQKIIDGRRWERWRTPDEKGLPFHQLSDHRQQWMISTCSRYVWNEPAVKLARMKLTENLSMIDCDVASSVIKAVTASASKYFTAFGLVNTLEGLEKALIRRL